MPEVWWINHYAITPDRPGGTRHYDLGSELVERGIQTRIFASDVGLFTRKGDRIEAGKTFSIQRVGELEFVWVRSAEYEGNNWRRIWNMVSFARNLVRVATRRNLGSAPDVVIGSSPHLFAAYAAERLASRYKVPFILELRDLWPQALVDMGDVKESHPFIRLMRSLESYLYRKADAFVVLASGSKPYLEQRGIDGARVHFVPNGVHLGHFATGSTRDEARARFGFNRFTIVYAGAHGPANSLNTILEAAPMVAGLPVEFVLVGDGASKKALVGAAAAAGLANVRFMDPVSKAQMPDLLGAADAGVITLLNAKAFAYGVSPNKLFDYMGARLPVLCSVPGDMKAMVEEAGCGITSAPEDGAALAEAVRGMLALSDDERSAMASRGREYVSEHYSREKLADRMADLVRGIARK